MIRLDNHGNIVEDISACASVQDLETFIFCLRKMLVKSSSISEVGLTYPPSDKSFDPNVYSKDYISFIVATQKIELNVTGASFPISVYLTYRNKKSVPSPTFSSVELLVFTPGSKYATSIFKIHALGFTPSNFLTDIVAAINSFCSVVVPNLEQYYSLPAAAQTTLNAVMSASIQEWRTFVNKNVVTNG